MTTVSTPSSLPRIDIEGEGANYARDTYNYEHTRTRAGRAEEDVLSAFPVPPSHIPSSPSFPPVRTSSLVSVPSLRIGSPPNSPYSHPASGSGSAQQYQQQRQLQHHAPSAYASKSTSGVRRKDGSGDTGDVSEFGSKRDSAVSIDRLSVRSAANVGTPTSGRSYFTAPSTPMALTPSTAGSGSGGVGEAVDYFVFPPSSQPPISSSSSSSPPAFKSKRSSGASSGMSPISELTPTSSAPPSAFAFPTMSSPLPPNDSPTDATPAIGGPPCLPLPPLPRTPSTVSEHAARVFAAQQEARRGDAASIASSGRSTRSVRTNHGRKESSASALSVLSTVSAGPSLSEFGVRNPSGGASVSGSKRLSSTGREKSRTPRPLRIDIPPASSASSSGSPGMGTGVRSMGSLRSVGSLGSPTSLIMSPPSPSPSAFDRLREKVREEEMGREREREKGMEMERERERERARWKEEGSTHSPTASLFSVASITTTRSGMSAAESLRTRVSGMLGGLGTAGAGTGANVSANSSSGSTSVGRVRHGSGDSHGSENGNGNVAVGVSVSVIGAGMDDITGRETPQPPRQKCSQASLNLALSTQSSSMNLLVAEDLHADPLLARAVTPFTPTTPSRSGRNAYPESGVNTSPSPLEMTNMGRTLRAMSGARSPLPSSLSPIPPLSDADDDDDHMSAGLNSAGLLGQFPATPTSHTMVPQSFATPGTMLTKALSNGLLTASTSSSANGGISRTLSQSRRKPLPRAPLDNGSALDPMPESEEAETTGPSRKDSRSGRRGRDSGPRSGGATSPDIASMMCATPRPVRSVSSARSSGSGSMRASKRETRARPRPSLPSERERERALARASRASSAFSGSSVVSRFSQSSVREDPDDGDVDLEGAYGGIMLEVDPDATADYGVAIARHRGGYDLSPRFGAGEVANRDEMLMDELGGVGRDDYSAKETMHALDEQEVSESDSDIDLHTPLPHILLREGVLSPHSKVLASVASCSSLSSRGSLGSMKGLSGRESVVSNMTNGSVMTKSGLYKDERDTDRRRKRHRDGNLLREGLGLTTGLGWSDSEDEDAPSPLTHRLSKLALSRNNSMASFRSSSSKQSQFFMKSTPAVSRTSSTSSNRPNLNSSRSFYNSSGGLTRGTAPHPLSKSLSSTGLARSGPSPYAQHLNSKGREYEGVREGERSMSPSPVSGATSSSSVSLAFPPTPRDDDLCDSASDFNLLSSSPGIYKGRKQETAESGSLRAKTPIASLSKAGQLALRNRPRALSSSKSAPASTPDSAVDEPVPAVPRPSRFPGSGMTTPRPLRLPALQQQQMRAFGDREKERPLQPGEPAPRSGSILGYNRNLHDKQRAQLLTARAAAVGSNPSSPASPASPALSAYSAPPSSASAHGGRRTYGSMPSVSVLRPPTSASTATARTPSPSRLSAPTAGITTGKPRTGTGMVYRQSSLPPPRAGPMRGRPTVV
ncbi:hypothetical protein M0805_008020 [Coniferiporia weirii]|nr:hypothetical protein M0805_008020 [Coniferiporia weirii]